MAAGTATGTIVPTNAIVDKGDPVTITVTFKNAAGSNTATTATLKYEDPSGNETSVASGSLTAGGTGIYSYVITTDESGAWSYKWTGAGTVDAIDEGTFYVLNSDFA